MHMHVLAENSNYLIYKNYEDVTLRDKNTNRETLIGDFYGEADMAVISEDETFCAMCGCGVIIYFMKEPFQQYEYYVATDQWKDWGRNSAEADVWLDHIRCINNDTIEVTEENGSVHIIDVYRL